MSIGPAQTQKCLSPGQIDFEESATPASCCAWHSDKFDSRYHISAKSRFTFIGTFRTPKRLGKQKHIFFAITFSKILQFWRLPTAMVTSQRPSNEQPGGDGPCWTEELPSALLNQQLEIHLTHLTMCKRSRDPWWKDVESMESHLHLAKRP